MTVKEPTYESVMMANIQLHSRAADEYHTEPHFRPENVAKVEAQLCDLFTEVNAKNLLDMGCGTGFIIDIAKKYVSDITGVDATQAMLDKIDTRGSCQIELVCGDSGTVQLEAESFDVVTAYSFIHHLFDIKPTLSNAYKALRKGGKIYIDLEPNYYFWQSVNSLPADGQYDQIIKREVENVTYIDEQIQRRFGIDENVMNLAEYGKNIAGGFKANELQKTLQDSGFHDVKIFYTWFIGQGYLINENEYEVDKRTEYALVMDSMLRKALPVSRNMYKYIGAIATK